jgi:hypothetical protein
MAFFDAFEDVFDFRFGPFHMSRGADIKVRLQEGGVLEIEWPRKTTGEDIPVE